jgi:hypothetical protein
MTSALEKQVNGNHYTRLAIQPIEYIHANEIPYCEGNVIKYVSRWRCKGGVADLQKARHYIDLLIEMETLGLDKLLPHPPVHTTPARDLSDKIGDLLNDDPE